MTFITNNMTLNILVQSPKSTHHSLFSVNNLKSFKGTKGISASRMISTSRILERNEMDYSECLVHIDRVFSGPGGSRWSMGHASIFLKCHASGRPRLPFGKMSLHLNLPLTEDLRRTGRESTTSLLPYSCIPCILKIIQTILFPRKRYIRA